MIRSKGCW